jgi:hypothetical protein
VLRQSHGPRERPVNRRSLLVLHKGADCSTIVRSLLVAFFNRRSLLVLHAMRYSFHQNLLQNHKLTVAAKFLEGYLWEIPRNLSRKSQK